jgi:hypothetical protein
VLLLDLCIKTKKINAVANGWIKKLLEEHKEHNKDGMPYLICNWSREIYPE